MRVVLMFLLATLLSGVQAQERVRRVADPVRAQVEKSELDAISATVKGRCVDGKTGKPLAGCTIKLSAWGSAPSVPPKALTRPEPVTTNADGLFEVRVVAHEAYQAGFDASLPGRWPRTGRWRHLQPGEVVDLGAVALHHGVPAAGKLVDQQGKPIRGVSIGIYGIALGLGAEEDDSARSMHGMAKSVRWCTTLADGTFRSRDALPPGTYKLRLNNRDVSLIRRKEITIPSEGPMTPITLTVREEPFLSGIVVDENGQPVGGVTLDADMRLQGLQANATTLDDGTFKIYRVDNSPETVPIRVDDPGPCELAEPTNHFAWGTTGIKIELRRAVTVAITVVEAGTDKPIDEFAIRAYQTHALDYRSLDHRMRLAGHHADGKLEIAGVRRGRARIEIIPNDPQLHCVKVDIVAKDGIAPLRIEVPRLQPMMVQVLDAKGAPIKNAEVFVIEPGNSQRRDDKGFNKPRMDRGGRFGGPDMTYDSLVYRTTTDAGGQCIAYGIGGRSDLILAARIGDGKLHRATDIAFGPKGNGHTIRLVE